MSERLSPHSKCPRGNNPAEAEESVFLSLTRLSEGAEASHTVWPGGLTVGWLVVNKQSQIQSAWRSP